MSAVTETGGGLSGGYGGGGGLLRGSTSKNRPSHHIISVSF